jgi:hypothetical protein
MNNYYYYRQSNIQPETGLLANWRPTVIHSELLEISRIQENTV